VFAVTPVPEEERGRISRRKATETTIRIIRFFFNPQAQATL
jgi:hypothetical protein